MEKKSLRINIDDVPEDLSSLPADAEIVISDENELMDDSFWDGLNVE